MIGIVVTTVIKAIMLVLVIRFGQDIVIVNQQLTNGQFLVTGQNKHGNVVFEILLGEG
jgi:hypothetical protein